MSARTRLLVAVVALIPAALASAAPASAAYLRNLDSSYYTKGTVKSVVTGSSYDGCGKYSDASLTVYYDFMDGTGMNVTKVVVKYYLKASGVIAGGPMIVTASNGTQTYIKPGDSLGDYRYEYPFNSATKNKEGYSLVGTFTHSGSVKVTGRMIFFTKWWAIKGCGETNPVMGFAW